MASLLLREIWILYLFLFHLMPGTLSSVSKALNVSCASSVLSILSDPEPPAQAAPEGQWAGARAEPCVCS